MTILQQGEQLLYWRWCGASQPVSGQPIYAETPLRVYSMTKPVTVLSALILEEQGLLDLEAPVENWIPELAGARALTQPNAPLEDCIELTHGPSLKQLMTHTSGYSYNSPSGSTRRIVTVSRSMGHQLFQRRPVCQFNAILQWCIRLGQCSGACKFRNPVFHRGFQIKQPLFFQY